MAISTVFILASILLWANALGGLQYTTQAFKHADPQLAVVEEDADYSNQTAAPMTIKASRFTPEVLLSAPRRSTAIPSPDAAYALFTVGAYSFESHQKTKEIRLLSLETGQSTLLVNGSKSSEPHWLPGNQVLYLDTGKEGSTEFVVRGLDQGSEPYVAGVVDGPISDLKLQFLSDSKVAILGAAQATRDGSLYNPETAPKRYRHTSLLYDSPMVRHWDQYTTQERNSLWYGTLRLSQPKTAGEKARWELSAFTNALKGTGIESPIPPFPGTDHYDLASNGIIFVAKDPDLNPATHTKVNLYYISIDDFDSASSSGLLKIEANGLEGAASSPVFGRQGKAIAFLKMKEDGYESDKNRLLLVPDISDPSTIVELMASEDGKGRWDRSPSQVVWSIDGKTLYLVAEDAGRGLLWKLDVPASPRNMSDLPQPITEAGNVIDVQPLGDTLKLFLSGTSLVDNSYYGALDPKDPSSLNIISSSSHNGSSFGLSPSQVSSIWFTGANERKVHARVVVPSNFSKGSTYPLAYLIHGGPQGAWLDSWSTRWNPAVWAEQGYVVVMPNPTGSTGYGQDFTDAIRGNWGGSPYEDLVAGMDYVRDNLDYVDTERAIAAGASYGGFMINWINGHDLGRRFKALVCHDGVFSMANQISSDEQYFPNHDLGGPYWQARDTWDRWDPARHTENWETPQLVIHNENDFRLPISEGLAAFNVLQTRGIPSRFLTAQGENHWTLREENSLVWHTVVFNWINKYAGLPAYKENEEDIIEPQTRPLPANASERSLPIREKA